MIKYPHLIELRLTKTHKDYHEQFLFDAKMCLPNGVHIYMDYQLMEKVTHYFRRNTTPSHCVKIIYVFFLITNHDLLDI